MTTINTPDDLLRLVREDSTLRAEMRRELLSVELLEVPQRLTVMEQSIAALLEHAKTTNRRLDIIEGDIGEMRRDIDGLGDAFRVEVRAQSSYRGNYAQRAAAKDDLEIAYLFAGKHGLEDVKTRHISRNTLEAWLNDYRDLVKSLNIRLRAMRTFQRPDVIASVGDLYSADDTDPEFYIVIEASYTGETEDIDRATDHAKIIRAITGLEAYPVVVAVRLDDKMGPAARSRLYENVERFTNARDENAAYWYRLDSADFRPSEPH